MVCQLNTSSQPSFRRLLSVSPYLFSHQQRADSFLYPLSIHPLNQRSSGKFFSDNILSFLLIGLIWGFWEGFNYVVIANKINCRFPSHQTWLDYGALTCALYLSDVHGMISFHLHAIFRGFVCFYLDLWYARHSKENRQRLGLYFYLSIHLERILTPKQDFHFLNSKRGWDNRSQPHFLLAIKL